PIPDLGKPMETCTLVTANLYGKWLDERRISPLAKLTVGRKAATTKHMVFWRPFPLPAACCARRFWPIRSVIGGKRWSLTSEENGWRFWGRGRWAEFCSRHCWKKVCFRPVQLVPLYNMKSGRARWQKNCAYR